MHIQISKVGGKQRGDAKCGARGTARWLSLDRVFVCAAPFTFEPVQTGSGFAPAPVGLRPPRAKPPLCDRTFSASKSEFLARFWSRMQPAWHMECTWVIFSHITHAVLFHVWPAGFGAGILTVWIVLICKEFFLWWSNQAILVLNLVINENVVFSMW